MQKDPIIDFTLTYNRFKKPLFNYICKVMKSDMIAEDITHNVFMKLYDNIDRIRNSDAIEIWIFRTARNEIFSHFRKNKNKPKETLENHEDKFFEDNLQNDFEYKELINLIEKELKNMDDVYNEIYYLKIYSSMSYKEIAEMTNITEDLVRSRLFKVRKKLREAIIKLERG